MRLLSLLVLFGCANKNKPVSPTEPVGLPSLVYEVRRGDAVSHLMGTCHLPLDLAERVDTSLIDQARVVWVEAQLGDVDVMGMMAQMWDEEHALSSRVDRKTHAAIARRGGASMPASMAEHLEPWVVEMTLGLDRVMTDEQRAAMSNGGQIDVLDTFVIRRAEGAGVEVKAVETVEEQLAMLEGAQADFEALLFPDAGQREQTAKDANELLKLCYGTDLAALEPSLYADNEQNQTLLVDRNQRWLTPLVPELEQGGAFIAVGALHLPGPKGLLALFEGQGFKVRNLPRFSGELAVPQIPIEEPAVVDLMAVEVRDEVAARIATNLCAEGQLARTCLEPDVNACVRRLSHDSALCIDGSFSSPEELAAGATQPAFTGCVLGGLVARAMAIGFRDDPSCAPLLGALPRRP